MIKVSLSAYSLDEIFATMAGKDRVKLYSRLNQKHTWGDCEVSAITADDLHEHVNRMGIKFVFPEDCAADTLFLLPRQSWDDEGE